VILGRPCGQQQLRAVRVGTGTARHHEEIAADQAQGPGRFRKLDIIA
jgi:hypothetical protein